MEDLFSYIDNALTVTKNIVKRYGEEAKQRGITLQELSQEEGGDFSEELRLIELIIRDLPDGAEKESIDASYAELIVLVNQYNTK
jgi:hypothetical protein